MNPSAYLSRYGWNGGGLGYKQDGIKKPLLASQRKNFSGIGGKPIGGQSDQWWLGAFDAGLKSLNASDSERASLSSIPRTSRYFKAELYRNFVQGEGLSGTRDDESDLAPSSRNGKTFKSISLYDKKGRTPTESSDVEVSLAGTQCRGKSKRSKSKHANSKDEAILPKKKKRKREKERSAS